MRDNFPNEITSHELTDLKAIEQKSSERKERLDNKRFWIPVTFSIIAIIIALLSLWLQFKTSN